MAQRRKLGCGGALALIFLVAAVFAYWYVSVPLLAVLLIVVLVLYAKRQRMERERKRIEEEEARHRPGPRDPWLNEIAVALADFGFSEFSRNSADHLDGLPVEGDIRLDATRLTVVISLFQTAELAHQGEIALRAKPDVRRAIVEGTWIIRTENRVLYVANGQDGPVDEGRLNEVVQITAGIPVGPPRQAPAPVFRAPVPPKVPPRAVPRPTSAPQPPSADVLDQIKRLGELREKGLLTEQEFQAKKSELLGRI